MIISLKRYKKEIDELKKKKGVGSAPLEILDQYVDEEITYDEAINILNTENVQFGDLQRIIIESSHPALIKEELDNIHGEYLRDIFRELVKNRQEKRY